MPTLQDVADEAGVTKMTVSNVLNGRRERVSDATFERVMEVVQRLGYVRNASARSLSAKRSNIVALVYPSAMGASHALANPHDAVFLGELERHITNAGLYLMIHSATDVTSTAKSLRSWNVDGAIFLGTMADEAATLRAAHDVPMVFIDNYDVSPTISKVGIDDRLGGYLAGQRLARAGHTALAFVGPAHEADGVVRERHRGFVQALADHGIEFDSSNEYECNAHFDEALALCRRLSGSPLPFTAAFATADIIAVGLLKGLTLLGASVPGEVSIVGFDDLDVARQVSPEITTVRQDVPEKARTASEVLLRQLAAWPDASAEHRILGVELVERGSVGPPPTAGR